MPTTRPPSGAVWPTAAARGGGLLRRLFSARTLGLFGQLPASAIASYLSGLLIGREMPRRWTAWRRLRLDREITVIGSSDLTERYLMAIEDAGLRGRRAGRTPARAACF